MALVVYCGRILSTWYLVSIVLGSDVAPYQLPGSSYKSLSKLKQHIYKCVCGVCVVCICVWCGVWGVCGVCVYGCGVCVVWGVCGVVWGVCVGVWGVWCVWVCGCVCVGV